LFHVPFLSAIKGFIYLKMTGISKTSDEERDRVKRLSKHRIERMTRMNRKEHP